MREGKASRTAMFVAWARGLGTNVSRPDTFAPEVLPMPLSAPLRAMHRWPTAMAPVRGLARVVTAGMVDHVNLRTAAIDGALRAAVEDGIDQLVVLGAGLDGRAWRLPWLGGVDVLEVDHPGTQALKRKKADGLSAAARGVQYVPVDFATQRLADCLAEAHDERRRTFWIWEGVTPYLPPEAIDATLGDVAERSHPGSVLAVTYGTPSRTPITLPGLSHVIDFAFGALGEPLLGLSTPQQMDDRLRRHGFEVVADTDQRAWGEGRTLEPALAFPFRAERLAEAVRV